MNKTNNAIIKNTVFLKGEGTKALMIIVVAKEVCLIVACGHIWSYILQREKA